MIVTKSWLNQFINLEEINDKDFAQTMTFAGNKVETTYQINGETVFEFEITSNRPDTLSVIGLAREAAAVFNLPLKIPPVPVATKLSRPPRELVIKESSLIPSYTYVEITHVSIRPSNAAIKHKLEMIKINPTNNVVDVTNLLMWETGQPMHAFDLDQIQGTLTLRTAKKSEVITPLDHQERKLQGGEIIIEDEAKLVDLAGLMGGVTTEITEKTKNILLLVPIYDPVAIRYASKTTKLRTESSTRFEKKLDLTQTETVAKHAAALICTEASGQISSTFKSHATTWHPPTIKLNETTFQKRVGITLSQKDLDHYLKLLGIQATPNGFNPPSWRRDLTSDVDLIEEICRLYGYNRLPKTLPQGQIPTNRDAVTPNWCRLFSGSLCQLGYTETYGSTLISASLIKKIGNNPASHLKVLHPMSEDFEYLRGTIIETLLPFYNQNLNHSQKINLYEIGTVFYPTKSINTLPYETLELGIITNTKNFREVKGEIDYLAHQYHVSIDPKPHPHPPPFLLASTVLNLTSQSISVGVIGQINPDLLPSIYPPVYCYTLNLSTLYPNLIKQPTYPIISDKPALIEDYTFTLPPKTLIGPVIQAIKTHHAFIESVDLKNQFHQNFTFTVTYRHKERSLKDIEINPIRKDLVKILNQQFQAILVGKLI